MEEQKKRVPLLAKVIIAIVVGILVGLVAPAFVVRTMNTFNGLFDQLLKFVIPLIIVGLVTPAIAEVGRGAGKMLGVTVALAYLFTICSGLFSYGVSSAVLPMLVDKADAAALDAAAQTFAPYFTIAIPPMMDVMTALALSFMLGLGIAAFGSPILQQGFGELRDIVTKTISTVIIPLLPLYIFGIFLDMTAVGQVGSILTSFLIVIFVIFAMTAAMLLIQYSVAGLFARRNPLRLLATMMPAYFTALGTASSAATIPVTLRQAIKMGVREEVAGFVIPLCATIHLSGSMLKITSCAMLLMMMLGMPYDFQLMLGFIMMLGVVMVAAPGVPGGAIMAALGVLGSILGFGAKEQAMMIALYIAMDSFGTACNVTGDGSIALIVDRIDKMKKALAK